MLACFACHRLQLIRSLWRCGLLCGLLLACQASQSSNRENGEDLPVETSRGLRVEFSTCNSSYGDMGIRGTLIVPGADGAPVVEIESCGLLPVCQGVWEWSERILLAAVGPLGIANFTIGRVADSESCDRRSVYLQAFAEVAVTSLTKGRLDATVDAPTCLAGNVGEVEEDVLMERAIVEGLAAASSISSENRCNELTEENPCSTQPNHSALAAVTMWMRDREQSLEWNSHHDRLRNECLAEGDLKGYECRTFTYGSTYFSSWLRVMRFPAVAQALNHACASGGEAVVLGSSLGWQTLWIALTFGIRSVGYELMDHRVDAARLAAAHVAEHAEGLVEFHHKDALSSDLSNAVIIYLTDLIWEDYLTVQVANHVKHSLLKSGIGRRAVVISNKYTSWSKMKFELLGTLEVPVTWTAKQEFHFWRLSQYAGQR